VSDERIQALRRRVAEGDDQAVFELARELERIGVGEKSRAATGLGALVATVPMEPPPSRHSLTPDGPPYCAVCGGTGIDQDNHPFACPTCGGSGRG